MGNQGYGPESAVLEAGDVEIGAVEIKNATDDTRAVVGAASGVDSTTVSLAVADGNLHDSLGAVGAASDADGVVHGQLRYLAEALAALVADMAQVTDQTFNATKLVDQLALTTSADKSAQLSAGRYRIVATADCYFLQADTDAGTDLATYANGHLLPAGVVDYITVTGATDDYLAALVVSGTGVLTISGPF